MVYLKGMCHFLYGTVPSSSCEVPAQKEQLHHCSITTAQLSGKREFEFVTGAEGWILAFWTMVLHSLVYKSYPIKALDRSIGFQEVEAPRISRQLAHGGGKVVNPKHWPSLAPRRYPSY
jgi:hypothetical protein